MNSASQPHADAPHELPTAGATWPGHVHVPALDGIRGLAVLMVMLYHMNVLTTTTTADRVWTLFAGHGDMGVDAFFVLSGFLITGILLDAKGSANYFRNFYARRTLRIFPLYYAVVAFCLLILPHIPNPKAAKFGSIEADAMYYWLYLSNFAIAQRGRFVHGILDVSWSLAIEEQFYLIWPALVLLLDWTWLARLCVALILASIGSRIALLAMGTSSVAVYVLTYCRMDGLAMGALVALAMRSGQRYPASRAWGLAWVAGATLLATMILHDTGEYGLVTQVTGHSLASLVTACLLYLVVAAHSPALERAFATPWLRVLGKYSYALYLFHYPLMAIVRDVIYGPEQFLTLRGSQLPGEAVFVALGVGLSLAAAWLSYQLFERHFLKLKPFFAMGHSTR